MKAITISDVRVTAFRGGGGEHPYRELVVRLPLNAHTDKAFGPLSKAQRERTPVVLTIGNAASGDAAGGEGTS